MTNNESVKVDVPFVHKRHINGGSYCAKYPATVEGLIAGKPVYLYSFVL